MHGPFDQLAKRITARALWPTGVVSIQHEVTPDAQAADIWFQPDPARDAERLERGLLGRMMSVPAILEPFHDTPGLDEIRGCINKQLVLDRARAAEARRARHPRPIFPRLWILSPGRPERVLSGYRFAPIAGFPPGFLGRDPADALGIVVLRELPRTRDTLLLRLMSRGALLREAIGELIELPGDAWEREVAMNELVALRFEIPHDRLAEPEREYLMSTQELYEHWKRHYQNKGLEQGVQRGVKQALVTLYRSRFGDVPRAVADAIEGMHDASTLDRWVVLVGTASRAVADATLESAGRPAAS